MKIYYANMDGLKSEAQIQAAMNLLSEQRKEKMEKYKRREDWLRGVLAGLVLEYGLNEYGMRQKELRFIYGADGKPQSADCSKLHFNLTHSGTYAAAVFSEQENGIDLEQIRTGKMRIAERFFSQEEKKHLQENWSDELFTKIWTRKESYIKTTGIGMRQPLDAFSVLDGRWKDENGTEYFFESFAQIPGYYLSVCQTAEPVNTVPQEIDITSFLLDR